MNRSAPDGEGDDLGRLEVFVELVADQLGLPLTVEDAATDLRELEGWDSVHLLSLIVVLERRTARRLPLSDLLEAATLEGVHRLVVTR